MSELSKPLSIISESENSTVVTEYIPTEQDRSKYESEADLEKGFIKLLEQQGYEYLRINNEQDLLNNLRKQIERLNKYQFSENDWQRFLKDVICNPNKGILEKTRMIQRETVQEFLDEFDRLHNIKLIDKEDIHNNYLQVINQYIQETNTRENRYDVTILVNGLPMVHIELKRRGVGIREAFVQIDRYQRDSFWSNCGLYEYIQLFVISNGTNTKYYSNTTREGLLKEKERGSKFKTSNSFEFTSYWADSKNNNIYDLIDFTRTFFSKNTILNILTKYCVFTREELLLVMRPYQIVATEKIINKINIATTYKKYGTVEGGGFIWHTTGSGKTLTSFKTAQLASRIEGVDKVLFVVDRRDLDYQTKKEYDRFEEGSADSSTSSRVLERQLSNKDKNGGYHEYKVIITTIQKLNQFLKKHLTHPVYDKHMVFIFDECHRSQFGDMHNQIIKRFNKYHLFGFTGTPIFGKNSQGYTFDAKTQKQILKTTEQIFGDKLHTYTIVNAISDNNVLPFRIDYVNTIKENPNAKNAKVVSVDKESAKLDTKRIENNVKYLFDNYSIKTKGSNPYTLNGKQVYGFSSIFATESKKMAMHYYDAIKKKNQELEEKDRLKVALIYTWYANDTTLDGNFVTVHEDNSVSEQSARDFLEDAIRDYNILYKTNYDTNHFEEYRDSISDKMKNRELDMLIVVDMFLTGFDSTTLNTLWVDRNLEYHGLIQAFSRTNRILNNIKNCGNIVCFRDLEKQTDEAISLFADNDARGIILLKDFNSYYFGYEEMLEDGKTRHKEGYVDIVKELRKEYPLVPRFDMSSEVVKKSFVLLWGSLLRIKNVLSCYTEFKGKEILTDIEFQDYQSIYLDLYDEMKRKTKGDSEKITSDDIVFEMELVKSIDLNIDYILKLIARNHKLNIQDVEANVKILKKASASSQLRNKQELIKLFIAEINNDGLDNEEDITDKWNKFTKKQKERDLDALIQEHNLKEKETKEFVSNAFKDGVFDTFGSNFDKIIPKTSFFGGANKQKSEKVAIVLTEYFEKYKNI